MKGPLVVIAGAHLGYDLRAVPLGGGAAVMNALITHWARKSEFQMIVLGPGPGRGWEGFDCLEYHTIPWNPPRKDPEVRITDLSVRGYADFSRQFSKGVLSFLESLVREVPPERIVVVQNDISEAADFAKVKRLGVSQVGIIHVDVVDYVSNIYLRGRVGAPTLARGWRRVRYLRWALPLVLSLIFKKQERCARFCDLLVVPSGAMGELLSREYPWLTPARIRVVPWGLIDEPCPPSEVREAKERIVRQYLIDGSRPIVLSLSRIAPEKGQDLLVKALKLWERRERRPLVAFLCGEPAFVHGKGYMEGLRRLSRGFRYVELYFPGYVTGPEKRAFFELADLYVFPSRHESYGLTMLEAMGAGLPVLTTPHRSAADLVREGWGRVVPPTPEGLYRGLVELLGMRDELPKMGERAARFARTMPFSRAADALAREIKALHLEATKVSIRN